MSLRVWLPLNGDLHNQGISDITAQNMGGVTTNSTGKIGACMSFNGGSTGHLRMPAILTATDNFSICFWMKLNNNTGNHCFYSQRTGANANGFTIFYISGGGIRFDDGASLTMESALNANQWYHVTCCRDNDKKYIYINGILNKSGTRTSTNASKINANYSIIGGSQNNAAGASPSDNYLNGYLNDYRIYNHCLSAAEVKEIAQGLVLHYKLDSFQGGYGNKNLLARYVVPGQAAPTSTANGGRTTWLGDYKITIPATESADTYFRLFMTQQLVSGTTYTISCKVSGLLNGSYYRFPLFSQSNTSMGVLNLDHNGLCSLTFTMSWTGTQTAATGANGETVYVNFLDDSSRAIATGQGAITLYDFKLEEGSSATPWCPSDTSLTQIQDCSGYNHNGTVVGDIEISQDTPRYNTCIHFSANNQYIKCSNINFTGSSSTFTFAWWGKCATYTSTMMWGFSNGNRLNGIYNGKTWNTGDGGSNPLYNPGTTTTVTTPTADEWHHFAMVADGITCKVYQDGELWGQAKTFKTCTGTNLYLNGWDSGTNYKNTNAFLSDFRIYCTPLLDTDIKQLYNVGMKIDKTQNIHNFELVEKGYNILAATPWCSSYNTHNPITSPFTNFNANGEVQFTTNGSSAGTNYLEITPGVYEYDYTISVNTGNQFYIGFERYDANKTSRSNNACAYTYSTKSSTDIIKQRYKGTVNLSTDGTNPLKYMALRILNGWSGTTSGVTGQATIHNFSLRLQSAAINPKIIKAGQLIGDEFKEYLSAKFYKNHIIEANQFIER